MRAARARCGSARERVEIQISIAPRHPPPNVDEGKASQRCNADRSATLTVLKTAQLCSRQGNALLVSALASDWSVVVRARSADTSSHDRR